MTTGRAAFKGAQVRYTKGHLEFVPDEVLREVSIHQVYQWVRDGTWNKKSFERWCVVLAIPLD